MKTKSNGVRIAIFFFASIVLLSFSASAQQATFQDPLLEHLVGKWVLQGTIGEDDARY